MDTSFIDSKSYQKIINENFKPIIFPILNTEIETKPILNETDLLYCIDNIGYLKNVKELNTIKSNIDSLQEKEWDLLKKKSNCFECVTINGGIANYTPISRAYFKMLEIVHHFKADILKAIDSDSNFTSLHLAEGPGGFMECLHETFLKMGYDSFKMYGITLVKEDKSIPAWKKSSVFIEFHKQIQILLGKDHTGDLYNIENIYDVANSIEKKASIITGDGGFDFSNDFNQQENLSFPLLYSQTLTALLSQKLGGMFILKIFDIYHIKTMNLLNILTKSYNKVYIIKPYTSRPANSEKYVVCLDFRDSISKENIHTLLLDIPKLGSSHLNRDLEIFRYINPSFSYYQCLHDINHIFFERQKKFIEKTLNLRNLDYLETQKDELFKNQIYTCIEWCNMYNVKINFLSKFLNSYIKNNSQVS